MPIRGRSLTPSSPPSRALVAPLLALAAASAFGCQDIRTEVHIGFLFPRDAVSLTPANNATVTLSPDGFTNTVATDGPSFGVEIELPPDDTARELAVFLAQDDVLLGYGRTPPFTYSGALGAGVVVFVGLPGTLATLDRTFDLPDASTQVASSIGRGAIALGADGSAVFLDGYTYDLLALAPLADPPDPQDGVMVGDSTGSVTRVAFEAGVQAHRYGYGTDVWTSVLFEDVPPRLGAATWFDAAAERLYIAGGGTQTDVGVVDVSPEGLEAPSFTASPDFTLDGPRQGGALLGAASEASPPRLLVFGGDDPELPLVFDTTTGGHGDGVLWTQASCVWLTAGRDALCAGGLLDDGPTADAVRIRFADAAAAPSIERLTDLLPIPIGDVAWLEDDDAVYAQGAARLVRIRRDTLETTEPAGAPARAAGGGRALLPTGVTLLAGGVGTDGAAVPIWQVFTPEFPAG